MVLHLLLKINVMKRLINVGHILEYRHIESHNRWLKFQERAENIIHLIGSIQQVGRKIAIKSAGGKHAGYECSWQGSRIEDHPDGHSHLPGEPHHDCPHLHVYVNGKSYAIIQYKRNSL
jgi:hypothetical protein